MKYISTFLFTIFSLFLISCQDEHIAFEQKSLFSINYGSAKNEISYFLNDDNIYSDNSSLVQAMTVDSFVYVSDRKQGKIVKYNSYGDFIAIYQLNEDQELVSFTVDENQNICVWFHVSDDKHIWDDDIETTLSDSFVIFYSDGTSSLPQTDNNLFPMISDIYFVNSNKNIVTSKIPGGFLTYFLDSTKKITKTKYFTSKTFEESQESDLLFQIDNMALSSEQNTLFLLINCYKKEQEINFYSSCIYQYDIDTDKLTLCYSLPKVSFKEPDNLFQTTYSLLGLTAKNNFFFYTPISSSSYKLIIMSPNGKLLNEAELNIDNRGIIHETLKLNQKGIITGVCPEKGKSTIYWWRGDLLLK